jgi:large subunit ribosomal protein L24
MPISISNVLPVDPKTNKPTRVAFRIGADGSKERTAKKSGQTLGTVKKVK